MIIVHPGRQHSFRLADALENKGWLHSYVTSVYIKRSSILFLVLSIVVPRQISRIEKRFSLGIPKEKIKTELFLFGLLVLLLHRVDSSKNLYGRVNRYFINRFGRKVSKYVLKENVEVVIGYDNAVSRLFTELIRHKCSAMRIIDHAHPPRNYLHNVYSDLLNRNNAVINSFERNGYIRSKKTANYYYRELLLGEKHIVASSFSRAGLEFSGIHTSKDTAIIPYGVNFSRFGHKYVERNSSKLRVLFVGELNQRKGLNEILEAAACLDENRYSFVLVGEFYGDNSGFVQPSPNVEFLGRVTIDVLTQQYREADVFLFPSYGEGFGLVLLEAMASSCVPIASTNCAAPDLISEDCGFIIRPGETKSIVSILSHLYSDRETLRVMANNSYLKARKFTWELYNQNIINAIQKWVE